MAVDQGPVVFAVVAAVVLCAALLAFGLIRPAPARPQTSLALAFASAVALLAATPISFSYDDGCNYDWVLSPALAAPFTAQARPQNAMAAYGDGQTLVACSGMQ